MLCSYQSCKTRSGCSMAGMRGEAGGPVRGTWKCCRQNTEGPKLRHPLATITLTACPPMPCGGCGFIRRDGQNWPANRAHPHTPQLVPFLGSLTILQGRSFPVSG